MRHLRFLWSRQFWVGFAAVNCWYDAVLVLGGSTGMEHDDCGIMPELILSLTDAKLAAMLLDQVNKLVMRGRLS